MQNSTISEAVNSEPESFSGIGCASVGLSLRAQQKSGCCFVAGEKHIAALIRIPTRSYVLFDYRREERGLSTRGREG